MTESIAAIVPVLNEETAIGHVVAGLRSAGIDEVIVVDGGSTDTTAERAAAAGARVLLERRRGYGRACASGAAATTAGVLVFIDGDGADDPSAVLKLLQPVLDGAADLALGARGQMERGALPWHAVAGNRLAAGLINLLWGQRISDLPSYKALRRDTLAKLGLTESTYGWTIEMIVKAARRRYRLLEIAIPYRRRMGGESKVSGNLRTSIKAARSILTTLGRHGFTNSGGPPLIAT